MGMKLKILGALLVFAGCALLVAGASLIYPPAGFVTAGFLLLIIGWLTIDALGANP